MYGLRVLANLRVGDQVERGAEGGGTRARLDHFGREMAAEGARAVNTAEQARHVPGDGVEPDAAGELALDIGNERLRRAFGVA